MLVSIGENERGIQIRPKDRFLSLVSLRSTIMSQKEFYQQGISRKGILSVLSKVFQIREADATTRNVHKILVFATLLVWSMTASSGGQKVQPVLPSLACGNGGTTTKPVQFRTLDDPLPMPYSEPVTGVRSVRRPFPFPLSRPES